MTKTALQQAGKPQRPFADRWPWEHPEQRVCTIHVERDQLRAAADALAAIEAGAASVPEDRDRIIDQLGWFGRFVPEQHFDKYKACLVSISAALPPPAGSRGDARAGLDCRQERRNQRPHHNGHTSRGRRQLALR